MTLSRCGAVSSHRFWDLSALITRFAIVGAASYTSAITRTFAMAITVIEILGIHSLALSASLASLVAMSVANKLALPFFDMGLKGKKLGGIADITQTSRALMPITDVMQEFDLHSESTFFHHTSELSRLRRLQTLQ